MRRRRPRTSIARAAVALACSSIGASVASCGGSPPPPAEAPVAFAPKPPPRVAHVAPFLIDATEVTVEAYALCVEAKACPAVVRGASDDRAACNAGDPTRAQHPIDCIGWSAADAYCAWIGKRLPTEDEWEWAARNGDRATSYPWGDAPPDPETARFGVAAHASQATLPVGTLPRGSNGAGVHDLMGNVAEWTSTPSPDGTGRAVRGGSSRDATLPTASTRRPQRFLPATGDGWPSVGFRCAKSGP